MLVILLLLPLLPAVAGVEPVVVVPVEEDVVGVEGLLRHRVVAVVLVDRGAVAASSGGLLLWVVVGALLVARGRRRAVR